MFGLYALGYWYPAVADLLGLILKAEASAGSSLVLLLIAVGVGVCISGARYFIFQKILYRKHSLSDDLYRRLDSDKLAVHKAIAEEHYRYHQFYGGCFIAAFILFAGWLLHGQLVCNWAVGFATIEFLVFELLMERSASDSFRKYVNKCNAIGQEIPSTQP